MVTSIKPNHMDSSDIISQYQSHGFVLLEGIVDPTVAKRLVGQAPSQIKTKLKQMNAEEHAQAIRWGDHEFLHLVPRVSSLYTDRRLTRANNRHANSNTFTKSDKEFEKMYAPLESAVASVTHALTGKELPTSRHAFLRSMPYVGGPATMQRMPNQNVLTAYVGGSDLNIRMIQPNGVACESVDISDGALLCLPGVGIERHLLPKVSRNTQGYMLSAEPNLRAGQYAAVMGFVASRYGP